MELIIHIIVHSLNYKTCFALDKMQNKISLFLHFFTCTILLKSRNFSVLIKSYIMKIEIALITINLNYCFI